MNALRIKGGSVGLALLAWLAGPAGVLAAPPAAEPGESDSARITVEAHGRPPSLPVIFTAAADETVQMGTAEVVGTTRLTLQLVQGRPEVLTLGLSGDGDVVAVSGAGLRDWSVRQGVDRDAGKRFLDLRMEAGSGDPRRWEALVRTRQKEPPVPGTAAILLLSPGAALGFDLRVRVQTDATVDVRLARANGATAVDRVTGRQDAFVFLAQGEARLEFDLMRRGAAPPEAELLGTHLVGRLNEAGGSVDFELQAQARSGHAGARLRILSGQAALNQQAAGDGWHVELVTGGRETAYDLVLDRAGMVPVNFGFAAKVSARGDWSRLNFHMPAGTAVPLALTGLGERVEFDPTTPVLPAAQGAGWEGFLPADGAAVLAWKHSHEKEEGQLFFTSSEQTEVRVGAGMVRQDSAIAFRVLQGKLPAVRLAIDGPGEVVGVTGTHVLAWKVVPQPGGNARFLDVELSRPLETEGALEISSQAAVGGFPARIEPLRLTPVGGVRHSGFVRITNSGAVRIEVADAAGMMQLSPEQFPGERRDDGARQVLVYRFPAAEHSYQVLASQVQPEVEVSEIATYELTESARVIEADLDLDIREAPVRAWSLGIPADYSVLAATGVDVADTQLDSAASRGVRALTLVFGQDVQGRQLIHLRLEKNEAAGPGEWRLPALTFPGAKSVRGQIGVVAAAGYRMAAGPAADLTEVPLSYFARQVAGLQEAYRVRDPDWSAVMNVSALGQSVQADVFHLYSLKQGVVAASVLINYFVVGAPANEWQIEVPPGAGNIDVTGQGVRRDWRREGNRLIVSLHQPVLGASSVLVTLEEPMSGRGGTLAPGEVRPIGVQSERGYLQVVSPLQVKSTIEKADGLLKLEPLELPAEYRVLTSAPSLAVYQYTGRPFSLIMGMEWYQPGEIVEQVIDFAQLTSQVSRDGQVVTAARFFVKTRGRKALSLKMPPGAELWECRVDNELVAARADGDRTLIPLPARLDLNVPVEVALRIGQPAGGSPGAVTLAAPAISAPIVSGEWTVRGDPERLLVARGAAAPTEPNLAESGFEWIAERGWSSLGLLLLMGMAGAAARRTRSDRWMPAAFVAGALGVFLAIALASAATDRRPNVNELTYAATMVPVDGSFAIEVENVAPWRAMVSAWGVAAAMAGIAACAVAGSRPFRLGRAALAKALFCGGAVLLGAGLLAQKDGALLFFPAIALALLLAVVLPAAGRLLGWFAAWRAGKGPQGVPSRPAPVGPVLMLALLWAGGSAVPARAQLAANQSVPRATDSAASPAQAVVQRWDIRHGRLYGELELTVRGGPGESFVLLRSPAVLTEFQGDGLRVGKLARLGGEDYEVAPERQGLLTARAKFELPVPDLTRGLPLLTGPAAVQRVTVRLDQGGWEFVSPFAVEVQPSSGLTDGESGATLVLGPGGAPEIQLVPRGRDSRTEATEFTVESADLFVPGPGVVNGYARVSVHPVKGQVGAIDLEIPDGFTVGEAGGGPIGAWTFEPEKHRLHVVVEPAQADRFSFVVATQRGAGALPFGLELRPLRVAGAASEVGMLGMAFGNDAQPEAIRAEGLSAVSIADFDGDLVPRGRDRQPLAVLQSAYRFQAGTGALGLRVAPVAPEVRVDTRQVISLGDDRLLLAADLRVAITRVGLFQLSFILPDGLEVESLSGAALNHWAEAKEGSERIVTLQLNGRTLGDQAFSVTLVGPVPLANGPWSVPRLLVREATRQIGELQIVPEKGLGLKALGRAGVAELDAEAAAAIPPGALAFRLLQQDWSLEVGIQTLEPWVTVQALEEVTAREGQTATRIGVRYKVENAAVKQLRVDLPGLNEEQVRTVRASGPAVSDLVPVAGKPGAWELHFQRRVLGETAVQIEFQGAAARAAGQERVGLPVFEGAREVAQFVAVRSGGQVELATGELPRGWEPVDWGTVPAFLEDRAERSLPAFAFRVVEPDEALLVNVRRHGAADTLKLRVTKALLTSVLAPAGAVLTAVDLQLEVAEKSALRVRLPAGARLFSILLNGESIAAVGEGEDHLFNVTANSAAGRTAEVRFVYAVMRAQVGRDRLVGPGLNVPLENVSWQVVIPPGYALASYRGALQLEGEVENPNVSAEDYLSAVTRSRALAAQQASEAMSQANSLLQRGNQEQAAEILSQISNARALDEATNEDARVQLRALKTEQTMVGLNTRLQRMYIENSASGVRNEQIEQAANENPFMRNSVNFNPQEVDQMLMGNSLEANTALRGIAGRIVDQQVEAEPAPSAIDVNVPERGRVLTFTRSLQVDGAQPLELTLKVERDQTGGAGFGLEVLLGLGVAAALLPGRRQKPVPATPRLDPAVGSV